MSNRRNSFPPRPKRGDLVNVRRAHMHSGPNRGVTEYTGALVLEYFDSNVYEPASCQLFYEGDIFWANVRDLTVITSKEDVKKA